MRTGSLTRDGSGTTTCPHTEIVEILNIARRQFHRPIGRHMDGVIVNASRAGVEPESDLHLEERVVVDLVATTQVPVDLYAIPGSRDATETDVANCILFDNQVLRR